MKILNTTDIKNQIDFGIICIRDDEFQAILKRFPSYCSAKGNRLYGISKCELSGSNYFSIALVKCTEQGTGEAQDVTRDLIEDLAPKHIMVVGIAGAVPEYEFSLGDVIVATRLLDFTIEAKVQDQASEYAVYGGPMHKMVQDILNHLPTLLSNIEPWNSVDSIGFEQPPINLQDSNLYGSEKWKMKVKETLKNRFANNCTNRKPLFTSLPIASSDRLIKDTETISIWRQCARQIAAIEMELSGIYRAARRIDNEFPIFAIRGISDIVGFKRDPRWTTYACNTAASFAKAFLKICPIIPINSSFKFKIEKLISNLFEKEDSNVTREIAIEIHSLILNDPNPAYLPILLFAFHRKAYDPATQSWIIYSIGEINSIEALQTLKDLDLLSVHALVKKAISDSMNKIISSLKS